MLNDGGAKAMQFDLNTAAPQRWKNRAGVTRELAVRDTGFGQIIWRLSVAEISRTCAFSVFPGQERCLTVVAGQGISLDQGTGRHRIDPFQPFRFNGADAMECTLTSGPCTAFNVIYDPLAVRVGVQVLTGQNTTSGADETVVFAAKGAVFLGARRVGEGCGFCATEDVDIRVPDGARALCVVFHYL
jgi:environmental stress-induced protein Ves